MAQDSDFKYISVEDDDEIVIQAGAVSSPGQERQASIEDDEALDAAGSAESDELLGDALVEEDSPEDDKSAADAQGDADQARFEKEKARRQAMAEANRMVTTEEDLKASVPFAGMQRAIIIIAIVLIAVFVIYFNFGR